MQHTQHTYNFRYSSLAVSCAAAGSYGCDGDAVLRLPPPSTSIDNQKVTRYATTVPDSAGVVVVIFCVGHEACSR